MLFANVCKRFYVLKLVIFVIAQGFAFSFALASDDGKKVDRIVTSLKRNPRCESVILSSNNLSAIFWLNDKAELQSSQPLWTVDSRNKLSKMIKNIKLNHKVMDISLPTQTQYESDPYKTSQVINRMTIDAINEFKWKGSLDCKAKPVVSKAHFIFNLFGRFSPHAEASNELSGGRRTKLTSPAAITTLDENTAALTLASSLKKKNENGTCRSFLIESKNLTAVMWIENAQLVSGGYIWGKEARNKFKDEIKDVQVVKRNLKLNLPNAKNYAKDPIRSAKILEQEFDNAFRRAKEQQQFRCGISAIN